MFFPASKIILKHPQHKNKILMIKRTISGKIQYEPVGGRVNADFINKIAENLEQCAIRETKEELGLTVSIEKYLGSYYFFWTTESNKGCSCALFLGNIIEEDKFFKGNEDTTELPLEPAWITLEDIKNGKAYIATDCHIGLKELIINYLSQEK